MINPTYIIADRRWDEERVLYAYTTLPNRCYEFLDAANRNRYPTECIWKLTVKMEKQNET